MLFLWLFCLPGAWKLILSLRRCSAQPAQVPVLWSTNRQRVCEISVRTITCGLVMTRKTTKKSIIFLHIMKGQMLLLSFWLFILDWWINLFTYKCHLLRSQQPVPILTAVLAALRLSEKHPFGKPQSAPGRGLVKRTLSIPQRLLKKRIIES